MIRDKIGKYKIVRQVGEGAFGIVYLVHNSDDNNKPFAIK